MFSLPFWMRQVRKAKKDAAIRRAVDAVAACRIELLEDRRLLAAEIDITDTVLPADDLAVTCDNTAVGGTSPVETFTLTNSGDADLNVTTFAVGGANASDFVVTIRDNGGEVVTGEAFTIGAGLAYSLDVEFAPAIAGAKAANITFNTNDLTDGEDAITLTMDGTALPMGPEISITDSTDPDDDLTLDIPGTNMGQTSDVETFTLSNVGDQTLEITNFAKGGVDADDFTVVVKDDANNTIVGDFNIPASTDYTIQVTFTPGDTGARTANITFDTNDATGGEDSILLTLNSTGLQPPVAPSGLTATPVSSSQINLSWSDDSGDEDGFRIYQSTNAGGPFTEVAEVGSNVENYSRTGLKYFTQYYFRVVAFNTDGESDFAAANARTNSPTENPTNNTPSTAISYLGLRSVKAYSDYVGNDDTIDFYKFSVPVNGAVRIDLTQLTDSTTMKLFESLGGNKLGPQINSKTSSSSTAIAINAVVGKVYIIRVSRTANGDASNYRIQFTPDFAGSFRTNARNIGTLTSGSQQFTDVVGPLDQADFYKFTLTSSKTVTLLLSSLSADVDLELQDRSGNRIELSENSGTANETITQTLAAGTYFIRIFPFEPVINTNYRLTVTVS